MAQYDASAPWYYGSDGKEYPAVNDGSGWTFPNAPRGDDGLEVRYVEDPAVIHARTVELLGFDPDDKRVNPDQSVSIMNPKTGQYEQAVAAGDVGTYMPISMANEQKLPILQYAMEPKDTGALGQVLDVADPLVKMYAIAMGANALGGGLNMIPGVGPSMPPAPPIPGGEVASAFGGTDPTSVLTHAVDAGGGGALGGAQAMAGAADPIEALHMAMNATGTETASAAANALGFATPEAMVASVNPAWAAAAGAAGGALGGSGAATTGGALGGTGAATAAGAAATAAGAGGSEEAMTQAARDAQIKQLGGAGAGAGGAGTIAKLTGILNGTGSWSDLSTSDLLSLGLVGGGLLESATKNSSTTNKVELPEWYTDASKKAIALADAQAAKPFTAFGGESVAPLSENERLAIQTAKDSAGNWKPLLDDATAMTKASTMSIADMDLSKYMNPYLDLVYAPQRRQIERDIAQAKIAQDAKAGMVGAFGGTRNAIESSLLDERKFNALSDLYGSSYSKAFDNATSLATGDLSRKASAGSALTSQAGATSALTGSDIGRLGTTGTVDRGVRQAQDDFNVSEFKREQDDTKKKIEGYTSALRGNPGTTTTSTPPAPSLVGQAVGAFGAINTAEKNGWFA